MAPQFRPLFEAAARPYRAAGRYAWYFARGKLRYDPAFAALLRLGLLPERGTLVDVGCGQGLLLALLTAARQEHAAGRWPADWPAPPTALALHGIDSHPGRVKVARRVLDGQVQVELCDLRAFEFRPCAAIVILDVLMFLDEAEQERALDKVAAALEPGGLLLMREPDAAAGLAYQATKWSAWLDAAARARLAPPLHCRSSARWQASLAQRGFKVDAHPMSQGTPYANVLFAARKVL